MSTNPVLAIPELLWFTENFDCNNLMLLDLEACRKLLLVVEFLTRMALALI